MITFIIVFICIAIIGALFGGESFGNSIRTGCGVIFWIMAILVIVGARRISNA
ncbi:MAG: hypothetical protein HOP11_10810 [Saprospiraceae bacterium]|nr:hypothetical protein [Saprospiraceae bacterium]